MRFCVAAAMLLSVWTNHAAADLYRWVDPETGSVKFSSYPPPWFGDAARERRAPKVEQIPAGKPPAAIETPSADERVPPKPRPEAGAKPQAPANSSLEERRKLLLKQIAALAANIATAKPEEGARIYADFADRVREYGSAEKFLVQVDAAGEGARRADWSGLVVVVDARRGKMLEQIAATRLPAEGSPPERVRDAWEDLGRQLATLGLVDNALKLLDPGRAPLRDAEQQALAEKIARQWKPLLDASQPRPAQ